MINILAVRQWFRRPRMKIFRMNDCEWWIGASLEDCIADYVKFTGDRDGLDDPWELDQQALESLQFHDSDETGSLTGVTRTFKEQRDVEIEKGGDFPRLFASTEY